jgi:ParB family transcriptional regulator, chromosome partitioning protein
MGSSKQATTSSHRHWYERRLGRTVLRAYRGVVDVYNLLPNERQPRMGPKEDAELQRQIEANEGIFEPLLVEPHPNLPGKFRIIDGDRRWTNSKILVEVQKKDHYRTIPAEITDRTLTDDERLRVWIYIHRQRKEWDTKEKEMVAYSLVSIVGRASAANILGVTVRELDKLVDIYEMSEKLTSLSEPGASITWAREIKNINKNLLTPSVQDVLIRRINDKELTNSKDVRKLRQILKDPVARHDFLEKNASIEVAFQKVAPTSTTKEKGIVGDIDELAETIKRYSWTSLVALKGDQGVIRKIEEAERLLKELKKNLTK